MAQAQYSEYSVFLYHCPIITRKNFIHYNINLLDQQMQVTLNIGSHYKVKNGKLTPRQCPSEPSLNYRYIPYHPLNKPIEEDYFRATITELLEEKEQLLKLMQEKDEQIRNKNVGTYGSENRNEFIRSQQEVKDVRKKLTVTQSELEKQKQILVTKDKQINDVKIQNKNLKTTISSLGNQLDNLKDRLTKSQYETSKINKILASFNRTMEQASRLEYIIASNPELSENLSLESFEQSPHLRHSAAIGGYTTPRQKISDFNSNTLLKNRSAEENKLAYRLHSEGQGYDKNGKQFTKTWNTNFDDNKSSEDSEIQYQIPAKQVWNSNREPVSGTHSSRISMTRK